MIHNPDPERQFCRSGFLLRSTMKYIIKMAMRCSKSHFWFGLEKCQLFPKKGIWQRIIRGWHFLFGIIVQIKYVKNVLNVISSSEKWLYFQIYGHFKAEMPIVKAAAQWAVGSTVKSASFSVKENGCVSGEILTRFF